MQKLHKLAQDLRLLLFDLYASYSEYLKLIVGIVMGLVVCALLINGFLELLDELQDNELEVFDNAVATPIHGHRSPGLTALMEKITWMGDRNAYIIFTATLFVFFYLRYRSLIFPVQTTIVLLIAAGLNRWLKDLVDRPRPVSEQLVEVTSMSFPSGHAMSSLVFFGFLIYLGWRLVSTSWIRWLLTGLLSLVILLIGFSRIYLGVHYPSDVLAGYAAGGACLAVFISMFTYVRYRYAREGKEPQVSADEQG